MGVCFVCERLPAGGFDGPRLFFTQPRSLSYRGRGRSVWELGFLREALAEDAFLNFPHGVSR